MLNPSNNNHQLMKQMFIWVLALLTLTTSSAYAQNKKAKKQKTTQTADTLSVDYLKKRAEAGDANAQNSLGVCYYWGKQVEQNYETALKWWSVAAKANHVEAIANMGLCYQLGHGTKRDSVMAVKLYKSSIQRGNKKLVPEREKRVSEKFNMFDACFLADIYQEGKVVDRDLNKAVKYYLLAGNAGSVPSLMAAADIYEKDRNFPQAYKLFHMAASKEVKAAYKCGEYLYKGLGTKVDKAEAAKYLIQASNAGWPNAQIMLGDLYFKGEGLEQDVEKALSLYKSAALKNSPVAIWNVGLIYTNGAEKLNSNYQKGFYWLSLAAAKGMKKNLQVKLTALSGSEESGWKDTDFFTYVQGMQLLYGSDKRTDEALKCFEKLEKNGLAIGTTMKAECYAEKDWKKANEKKAVKFLEKAVEADEAQACFLMAQRYEDGQGVPADKAKALSLTEKAAKLGYAQAICRLGDYYREGKMVEKNLTKCIEYYIQSLKEGYLTPEAAKTLSNCYLQGLGGLKKDEKMAQAILTRAQKSDPVLGVLKDLNLE